MTEPRTPEAVLWTALRDVQNTGKVGVLSYSTQVELIMRALKQNGYEIVDMLGDLAQEVADLQAEAEDGKNLREHNQDSYPCVCGAVFAERWQREDHWNTAVAGRLVHGQPKGTL